MKSVCGVPVDDMNHSVFSSDSRKTQPEHQVKKLANGDEAATQEEPHVSSDIR